MNQTPREKADELVLRFANYVKEQNHKLLPNAIKCAMITVDEVIATVGAFDNYWQEVKKEIELL